MAAISSVTAMAAGMASYYAIMFLTGIRIPKDAIQIDFDGWTILKINVSVAG
jgi:molybdopterin-synthase adenylyltransferase